MSRKYRYLLCKTDDDTVAECWFILDTENEDSWKAVTFTMEDGKSAHLFSSRESAEKVYLQLENI
jgi:hypothetical protein